MAVEQLGASHFASQGWEVQRKNNFEISIPGVGDAERLLTLAISSGSLPNESNEPITIQYGNTEVKVAGTYRIQSGQLVVKDVIQKDVEAMIEAWRAQVYNKETDAVGLAANYYKQARITQFGPDGNIVRTWKVEGVWPSNVDYGQVSQSDNSLKEISLTLQYNKAILSRT